MMSKLRASRERDERGFTLIELLVVILIIAILAAIAIPVFLRQREKGWASQSRSALKNAAIEAETYSVDNKGSYDGFIVADSDFAPTEGVTVTAEDATATGYCLLAVHDQDTPDQFYSSASGTPEEGTCTPVPAPSP